ncbi:hypothetical protein B0H13DRAFT_2329588 [Mycena leptocephala]|nr:hypothetical protein B0H13DRAFT_2329588 [Mycena leptocephala]
MPASAFDILGVLSFAQGVVTLIAAGILAFRALTQQVRDNTMAVIDLYVQNARMAVSMAELSLDLDRHGTFLRDWMQDWNPGGLTEFVDSITGLPYALQWTRSAEIRKMIAEETARVSQLEAQLAEVRLMANIRKAIDEAFQASEAIRMQQHVQENREREDPLPAEIRSVFERCIPDGPYIVNLFDTFHTSKLLEFPGHGLANLLEMYCDFVPDKRYQLAAWPRSPRTCCSTTARTRNFLLFIYDNLSNALLDRAVSRSRSPSPAAATSTPPRVRAILVTSLLRLALRNTPPAQALVRQALARSEETALRTFAKEAYDFERGNESGGWDMLARKWNKGGLVAAAETPRGTERL